MIKEVELKNTSELAQLRQLHHDSQVEQHIILEGKEENDEFRDQVNKSLTESLLLEDVVFLLGISGAAYGYIQLRLPAKNGVAMIDDLYVEQTNRRKGLARELLVAGERVLRSHNAGKIFLYTQENNINARAAYEKSGYAVASIEDGYVNFEKYIVTDNLNG